jgi:hypothetical protein
MMTCSLSEAANFPLARLVYVARLSYAEHAHPTLRQNREKCVEVVTRAQELIAKHIRTATSDGTIGVQGEFDRVMTRFVLTCSRRIALLTTNWDSCVATAFAKWNRDVKAEYLHGSAESPEQLYLPTEVVEEPYRGKEQRRYLQQRRVSAMTTLKEASRVVVYGLGFSPLDVELGQVLALGMLGGAMREVLIIDPDYVRVAERIAVLNDSGGPDLGIFGVHPKRPGSTWKFSASTVDEEAKRLASWPDESA